MADIPDKFCILGNRNLLKAKSLYILASPFCTQYTYDILNTFVPSICAKNITLVIRRNDVIATQLLNYMLKFGGRFVILYDVDDKLIIHDSFLKTDKEDFCCILMPKSDNREINEVLSLVAHSLLVTESLSYIEFLELVTFTLNEGKDIFAIPGSVFAKTSVGTNSLVKRGAISVTDFTDINFD